jgi:hypothetical protein
MNDRQTTKRRCAIAAASVVVPLAAVLLALPQGGALLLLALVGGVVASLVLVELGQRHVSLRPTTARPGSAHDRVPVAGEHPTDAEHVVRHFWDRSGA